MRDLPIKSNFLRSSSKDSLSIPAAPPYLDRPVVDRKLLDTLSATTSFSSAIPEQVVHGNESTWTSTEGILYFAQCMKHLFRQVDGMSVKEESVFRYLDGFLGHYAQLKNYVKNEPMFLQESAACFWIMEEIMAFMSLQVHDRMVACGKMEIESNGERIALVDSPVLVRRKSLAWTEEESFPLCLKALRIFSRSGKCHDGRGLPHPFIPCYRSSFHDFIPSFAHPFMISSLHDSSPS